MLDYLWFADLCGFVFQNIFWFLEVVSHLPCEVNSHSCLVIPGFIFSSLIHLSIHPSILPSIHPSIHPILPSILFLLTPFDPLSQIFFIPPSLFFFFLYLFLSVHSFWLTATLYESNLQYPSPKGHIANTHKLQTNRAFAATFSYGSGFILWNIDNNFCPSLRLG